MQQETFFKVILLENGQAPKKADSGAAGYDLFSAENSSIEKGKRKLISAGI